MDDMLVLKGSYDELDEQFSVIWEYNHNDWHEFAQHAEDMYVLCAGNLCFDQAQCTDYLVQSKLFAI